MIFLNHNERAAGEKFENIYFISSSTSLLRWILSGFLGNKRTGLPATLEFPAAGYGPMDFHCERILNSWTDPLDLNAGWLTGLTDLNTEKEHVAVWDFY